MVELVNYVKIAMLFSIAVRLANPKSITISGRSVHGRPEQLRQLQVPQVLASVPAVPVGARRAQDIRLGPVERRGDYELHLLHHGFRLQSPDELRAERDHRGSLR